MPLCVCLCVCVIGLWHGLTASAYEHVQACIAGLDECIRSNAGIVSTLAISFFPVEEVREVARGLCLALYWLHDHCRIIHRDLQVHNHRKRRPPPPLHGCIRGAV